MPVLLKIRQHFRLRTARGLFLCVLCAALMGALTAGASGPVHAMAEEEIILQSNADGSVTADLFAMDTYMSLKAYGKNAKEALKAGAEEIRRLDRLLSTGREDSEISVLNKDGAAVLSEDVFGLFGRALEIGEETGGVFNVTIYPVMKLWGFPEKDYRVPSEEELSEALALADPGSVETDQNTRRVQFLKEGMAADLGGIAKGYTGARVTEIFREHGVDSGLVSLGGNVQALGKKPGGKKWKVAIQDPEGGTDYLGVLEVADEAVITSGAYERYFEENGVRYHHIIDPADGYPADSGVVSSTIVSSDGTLADALSTSLYIMGAEKAEAFWRECGGTFDYVLEAEDGTLYVTEGIADLFESTRKRVTVRKDG